MFVIPFSFPGDTIYQLGLVNSDIGSLGHPILALCGVLIFV